jgi:hypothetical protein
MTVATGSPAVMIYKEDKNRPSENSAGEMRSAFLRLASIRLMLKIPCNPA